MNDGKIDYMFTGAVAVSYYGLPRTTMDIDIVVKVTEENIQFFAEQLRKAGVQANEQKIHEAFKSDDRIITLNDRNTPFSIDIILSDKKLEKQPGTILDLPTFIQNPEALILSKLRMIKATIPKEKTLKDRDDVRAILKYTEINMNDLKRQARTESTISILEELTRSKDNPFS